MKIRKRTESDPPIKEVNWSPNPGPQSLLFDCTADIILYGGAKGGGKTEAMLIWAAQGIHLAGYRAAIFRRTFKQLERHVIPKSLDLFLPLVQAGLAAYDTREHRWTFVTPDGRFAYIDFAFLERDEDLQQYQGAEYARLGFDESTDFTERQIRVMLTCVRSPVEGISRQVLLASNPVGRGYGWHFHMFVKGRHQCTIYKDALWPSDKVPVLFSTIFIPANVFDNPVLLERDPLYPERLRTQWGPLAEALLKGDWNQTTNTAFDIDQDIHFCEPFDIPRDAPRWIAIDWGKSDLACTVWLASFDGRVWAYRDYARPGRVIVPYAEEVVALSQGEKIDYCVLSHETFADRGIGITQAQQFADVLSRANIPVQPSDRDPEGRLLLLREYLRIETARVPVEIVSLEDMSYWSRRFEQEGEEAFREYARLRNDMSAQRLPKLKVFRQDERFPRYGCPALTHTLPLLLTDASKPYRLVEGQEDDPFDALTYGLKVHLRNTGVTEDERYRILTQGGAPDSGFGIYFAKKAAHGAEESKQDELEAALRSSGEDRAYFWSREKFSNGRDSDSEFVPPSGAGIR